MMVNVTNVDKKTITLTSGLMIKVPCNGNLWSYLEFMDRLLLVVNIYDTKNCNQFRNIFCYSKKDGSLIWQIEQPFDGSKEDRPVLEEVFKNIKLYVGSNEGKLNRYCGSIEHPSGVIGNTYLKPFNYGIDRLNTMTLAHFPNEYWVDYETGKLEWIRFHQKI